MTINNLEQKRLLYALRAASPDGRKAKPLKKPSPNYDSMVKKVPAYIQKNGFVYTLAFLNEKDPEVFYDIWNWLCASPLNEQKLLTVAESEFLAYLLELEDHQHLRAFTLETLALMKCFRRFVKED